eukprot:scaffold136318_cov26-Cyclotella_meneghiniana.AAC.1
MSGNYQSTEQLRAENWIINEIVNMVMHPVKGLFPKMMKPVSEDDNEDDIVEYDWTFLPTAVKMLYIVLHNVTRYLYTQVSMKEWTQKNKGQPLYKMFTGNEYAFT